MSRRLFAAVAALTLAAGLAGCGKVGQLEPASPIFGKSDGTARAPAPSRPVETVDPRDRASDLQVPPPPGATPPSDTPRQ